MTPRPVNWVFLGDSLTEGVGSSRASYVTELATLLRRPGARAVHLVRLRDVNARTFNPFIPTNLAGFSELDPHPGASEEVWIWNLASEGKTVENDLEWLPWLRNLRPSRIFIYRGSLESIIRPAAIRDGAWPAWVPASWRDFVAMDPRCYFSTAVHRRVKQTTIDAVKQRVRLKLLAARPGRPLQDADTVVAHYERLLDGLRNLGARVHVLGLIPPDRDRFPGSAEHFAMLNARVQTLTGRMCASFLDWAADVEARRGGEPWRYRDGFHPNQAGARLLAEIIHDRMLSDAGERWQSGSRP